MTDDVEVEVTSCHFNKAHQKEGEEHDNNL